MDPPDASPTLGAAALGLGYRLEVLDEVASTNDIALRRARDNGASRLWIVARRQTGGRGRHGRPWDSPSGNLFASLMLIDPCDIARAPELGFVTGLALHEAVRALTGLDHPRLALKWPNDLLIDAAKCAGILLEGHRLEAGRFVLVIGTGVNVAAVPPGLEQAATSLQAFAPAATAARLLTLLADEFARRFASFVAAPGFDEAHFAEWGKRAHGIGSKVRVKLPQGEVEGKFHGLERGRLVLDTEAGRRTLDAGDLYVMNVTEASRQSA